jgi:hypothetical protein
MDSKAKMSILKELRKMAMDDMGEGLKSGLKKVTVAAPDEKGLKEGLEKAEDIVEDMPMMGKPDQMMSEMSDMKEDDSDMDMEKIISQCKSPEDIDQKIAMLEKAKQDMYGDKSSEDSEMSEEMMEA